MRNQLRIGQQRRDPASRACESRLLIRIECHPYITLKISERRNFLILSRTEPVNPEPVIREHRRQFRDSRRALVLWHLIFAFYPWGALRL
jgi:hypothetical protein